MNFRIKYFAFKTNNHSNKKIKVSKGKLVCTFEFRIPKKKNQKFWVKNNRKKNFVKNTVIS